MKLNYFKLLVVLTLLGVAFGAEAKKQLSLPRFASVKSGEVNVRAGPNVRYPVKWVFVKKGEPVEVLAEFDNWRKIKDVTGEEGWVHENMLSGRRFVVVTAQEAQILYSKSSDTSKKIAIIEPTVRAELHECEGAWCKIMVHDNKGWIKREAIFGVYDSESFE